MLAQPEGVRFDQTFDCAGKHLEWVTVSLPVVRAEAKKTVARWNGGMRAKQWFSPVCAGEFAFPGLLQFKMRHYPSQGPLTDIGNRGYNPGAYGPGAYGPGAYGPGAYAPGSYGLGSYVLAPTATAVQPARRAAIIASWSSFARTMIFAVGLDECIGHPLRNDLTTAATDAGNSSWIDSFPCGSSLSSARGTSAKASISARDLGGV